MGIEEIQHLLTNGIGVPSKVQFSNYIHERSSTQEVHEEVESKMYLQFLQQFISLHTPQIFSEAQHL